MTRSFAIIACALALAMPVGFEAQAGAKKVCKGTALMTGKTTKFVCKVKEKCCFDSLSGKGTCGKEAICL